MPRGTQSSQTAPEVIVVGAGPAGLSAALVLGRSRVRVLVLDDERPRNGRARRIHNYLGRDDTPPMSLRAVGRREVERYGVAIRQGSVASIERHEDGFHLLLADGSRLQARRLVLATGVEDPLPEVPGLARFYGSSVHHCPFCDGWEARDRAIGLYGKGHAGAEFAIKMTRWSPDVVLLTDGPSHLRAVDRQRLARHGVAVRDERIARLEGRGGQLQRVRFVTGEALAREVLFFGSKPRQRSPFAAQLGCQFTSKGMVEASRLQATGVPRLWVAGDACRDVQLAMIAAAEGAKAGVAIVADLERERVGAAPPTDAAADS